MGLPDNLRRHRENRGLYQKDAAALIGIPWGTYVSYERGEVDTPPAMYLYKIAKAYETTIEALLDLEPLSGTSSAALEAENDRLRRRLERFESIEVIAPFLERIHRDVGRVLEELNDEDTELAPVDGAPVLETS